MKLSDRFWKYVSKTGPKMPHMDTSCWIWTGCKDKNGYGRIGQQKNNKIIDIRAHRLSFQIHKGKIPKGMCILHDCDNPPCVNPEHLWSGTKNDNSKDMVRKGRSKNQVGEQNSNAKLTNLQVEDIRKLLSKGEMQISVAKKFGVSQPHIHYIKNNILRINT